jgi:hypothetical protein
MQKYWRYSSPKKLIMQLNYCNLWVSTLTL